ncbi:MAG: carboxypeptidase M32 [Rhodospirillaceae bacterium TMED8]|nr:carboxypeptidase M32 [Magnetovibrio sp.]OUT52231.1 MAG: carboxypeptidase M32 [Rhodospirillaceae bacterium TMED8]|tara:strand:- start:3680 stop:5182 length:1503 start_codon:yes stop_codon:yes gene_type:complete
MVPPVVAYKTLETRFHRIALLSEATSVLNWDAATVMPQGGATARGAQLAELRAVTHGLITAPDIGDLIAEAEENINELDGWQKANLREMAHIRLKANSVPEDLVVASSRACSICETTWREARAEADFPAVKPALQEVLNLTRKVGQAKAEATGLSLYDALLDDYEPGGRSANIDQLFTKLRHFLPDFIQRVVDRQQAFPPSQKPIGPFSISKQKSLAKKFMAAFGFDFNHGRLDVSLHPFCGGIPEDVRVTTRYDEGDFTSSLMGVLHETGHALYERGLPLPWRRQPVGEALGMGFHESQSLLIEMQVCRSREFLEWAVPIMKEIFLGSGPAWDINNVYRLYTRVEPSFIRVDADEVTYPAHIILRYQLERALLNRDLTLNELPTAWNDGMGDLLGITPPSDREGCLQDLHWYDGAWGYFPTYTIGAMTAAQLFDAAKYQDTSIEPSIAEGNFQPLLAWLSNNIHSKARLLNGPNLLINATGKSLDPDVFERHLRARYDC